MTKRKINFWDFPGVEEYIAEAFGIALHAARHRPRLFLSETGRINACYKDHRAKHFDSDKAVKIVLPYLYTVDPCTGKKFIFCKGIAEPQKGG